MNFKRINLGISWAVFAFTFIIYSLTVSPTVSYWDCGEFIASSYKLAVPHPPGAPFYLLLGRLFTLIPFVSDIGLRVNFISVFSSAFTIQLLYLTIVHLVREWKEKLETVSDWQTAIFSGLIGSLTFAFTHSFWFNAAEAEVYAPSMLFTALIVWLVLVWAERSEEKGSDKYLLMISYIIGLAIGVHLLNVLALPFVTMIVYYKKFPYSHKSFVINMVLTIAIVLFIYPGIVKYLPLIVEFAGVLGLVICFVALIWVVLWSMNNHKTLVSLASLSVLLIVIGYSTYSMIFIRSNLNPMIDENNPETIEKFVKYLNREQYGDHSIVNRTKVWKESPNGKRYTSVGDFFWNYQINKMYVRYFLWQFVGMDDDETNWSWKQFYWLPFLLGMIGIFWHFRHDPKRALTVLALFFMTGLAVILYLNQPDPQPRERDYSYVGSFFAFSIWVGLGYAGVLELIKGKTPSKPISQSLAIGSFVVLFLVVPIHMLAKNFKTHNRSGRYIAWDYSYNMLQSCEPNAILFTNGDNDTFPLWYLQEVDEVRTDIRIVNLSLLNTPWYIKQLKHLEPKVPIAYSDNEIDKLGLVPWKKAQVLEVPVPQDFGQQQHDEFHRAFSDRNIDVPSSIKFKVKAAMKTPYGPMLRVQDWMILHIIHANKWRKPIYFAVTVAKSNMLTELQQYMRMDGLSLKLVPYKNWNISPEHLERNLTEIYKYRGLQNGDIYYDKNIMGLLQNYRTAFLQIAEYYSRQRNMTKVQKLMSHMEENISSDVIPWTNNYLRLLRDSYTFISDQTQLDSFIVNSTNEQELQLVAEQLYRLNYPDKAAPIFQNLYDSNPSNVKSLSFLINIYEKTKQYQKGIEYLEAWLQKNPKDTQAKFKLEQLKRKIKS